EALRYRTALKNGVEALKKRPLSTAIAVDICRTIKNTNLDIRRVPGTKLTNTRTNEIIYTPPEGEALLRNKLANWERFLHEETEYDPLVRMAAAHYQFEAIHPFTDGSGRTGRVLNVLYLIDQELLSSPVLYLSRYIIQNKTDYYRLLLEVTTRESWEEWLLYMLKGVAETSKWTADKINAAKDLLENTVDYVRANAGSIYSRELVDALFVQPYCRINNLVKSGIGHRETVSKYLKALCGIGILEEIKVGREKLFLNKRFLELLTSDGNTYKGFTE
ncbi:MAG: Fic family protein, partial [Gammaproteobacteria bacterium]|nr:Fic family protein [Gammaproteobacteria bacterium]